MTDLRTSIHGRRFGLGPDDELISSEQRLTRPAVNCSISVGATQSAGITIQLQNARGENWSGYENVELLVFADAAGAALATTGGSTGIAIGANGIIMATLVSKKVFLCRTKSDGTLKLTWTDNASEAAYLGVQLPNGTVVISAALPTS